MGMDDAWIGYGSNIWSNGGPTPVSTTPPPTMSQAPNSLASIFGGDWRGNLPSSSTGNLVVDSLQNNSGTNVGNIFGDGKDWTLQRQTGANKDGFALWADGGKINKDFD